MMWLLLQGAFAASSLDLAAVLQHVDEAPSVRMAAAAVDQARGLALDALAVDAPQLRLGVNDIARPLSTPWASVGLRVPVPNPVTQVETKRAGASAVEVAERQLDEARDLAAQGLTLAFVDAVAAQQVALAWDEDVTRYEALVASTEVRRNQGFATALDLVRARADLARAGASAASAHAEADGARAQLLLRVGWSGAAPELVPSPLPELPGTLDGALDRAVADDAGLKALAATQLQAEHAAKAARGRAIPWFDWVQPTLQFEPLNTRLNLTTSVSLPVWAWGTGAAKAALAERTGAQAEAALRVDALHEQVTAAWYTWQSAHGAAAALEQSLAAIDADVAKADRSMHEAMRAEQGRLLVEVAEARRVEAVAGWGLVGVLR